MIPKFRAWDKQTKRLYKVQVLQFYGTDNTLDACQTNGVDFDGESTLGEPELNNLHNLILMQYTGIKDSEGNEIYEGDILKCTSRIYTNLGATGTGEYEETIKQVIWKDDSWGTRVISSNLTSKGAEKSGLVISAKYAKIIGNIYENTELLED